MQVTNLINEEGNAVKNQFIITDYNKPHNTDIETFQSYDSVIAKRTTDSNGFICVYLDTNTWNYSTTTSKYRNQFLNEGIAETRKKIASGEYILTDLNGGE